MSVRCFQRGLTVEGRPPRNIGGPSHGHGARQGSGFPVICFMLYLVPCLWLTVVGGDNWGDHTQMLSHFIPSTLRLHFNTNSLDSKAYLYLNLICYICWQPWSHMDTPSSNSQHRYMLFLFACLQILPDFFLTSEPWSPLTSCGGCSFLTLLESWHPASTRTLPPDFPLGGVLLLADFLVQADGDTQ